MIKHIIQPIFRYFFLKFKIWIPMDPALPLLCGSGSMDPEEFWKVVSTTPSWGWYKFCWPLRLFLDRWLLASPHEWPHNFLPTKPHGNSSRCCENLAEIPWFYSWLKSSFRTFEHPFSRNSPNHVQITSKFVIHMSRSSWVPEFPQEARAVWTTGKNGCGRFSPWLVVGYIVVVMVIPWLVVG